MFLYVGEIDSPAIVLDHCGQTDQNFSFEHLNQDPRVWVNDEGNEEVNVEYKDVKFTELNWNHVGHLGPGDKVLFQDTKGVFWWIRIGTYPSPGVDMVHRKKVMDGIEREQAQTRVEYEGRKPELMEKGLIK